MLRNPTTRETVLPAATLTFLRQALRKEAGALGATHALHGAGYATGRPVLDEFQSLLGELSAESLDPNRFWERLSGFFSDRGWGSFTHERVHPGLAVLTSHDWMEADESASESQPGCAFTCGVFAHLLSSVAGGPIAVLEVTCRSRGDDACRFLFGSEEAVHDLYGHLLEGATLEQALLRT